VNGLFRVAHGLASRIVSEIVTFAHLVAMKTLSRGRQVLRIIRRAYPGKVFQNYMVRYIPKIPKKSQKLLGRKSRILFIIVALQINLGSGVQSVAVTIRQIIENLTRIIGVAIPPNIIETGTWLVVLCP
jgi:hypothetical protein